MFIIHINGPTISIICKLYEYDTGLIIMTIKQVYYPRQVKHLYIMSSVFNKLCNNYHENYHLLFKFDTHNTEEAN